VREALAARFDRDFVVSAGSREGWPTALARVLRPAAAAVARRPFQTLGGVVLFATVVAVSVNALAWQTKRHPSPLFAAKPGHARPAPASSPRPALAAVPPVQTPAPPVRSREAAVDAPRVAPVPAPRPRDPIGEAIRTSETGSVTPNARFDTARSAAAAQRALVKLGHGAVKVDGVIGPGTRQAIERFERERKIPVTGELNPRTVKELTARSGLPIE
jgi:hypothetical protein